MVGYDRGDFLKRLSIFLCLLLAACSAPTNTEETKFEKIEDISYDTFDTVTKFAYYDDVGNGKEMVELLHERMLYYHKLFDIYNAYDGLNNAHTVNASPGEPVEVDEPMIELIELAKTLYADTGEKANIAMGSMLALWHDARETKVDGHYVLPKPEALLESKKHMDLSKVVVDREKRTVTITDPEVKLDIGAIAKGYAVERTAEALEAAGAKNFILSAGGDVRTAGNPPGRTDWKVGIQNPEHPLDQSSLLHVLTVGAPVSVVTSGDYQRYFEENGVRYHHIIDPDTMEPSRRFSSVTIVHPDSAYGDFLSTALFLVSIEEGEKIADRYDAAVLWITPDGKETMNDRMKALISDTE